MKFLGFYFRVFIGVLVFSSLAVAQESEIVDHRYFIRPVNVYTGDTVKTPVFYGFVDENPICLRLEKMQKLKFYGELVASPLKYLVVAFVNQTGTFSYSFFHDLDSPVLDLHINEPKIGDKDIEDIVVKEFKCRVLAGCER